MITNGFARKHSRQSENKVASLRTTCVTLTRVTLTMSKEKTMSWKPAIKTSGEDFHLNGQTFETKEEAEYMARDIFNRWMLATDHKAVESDEPANYRITNGVLEPIQKEAAA